MFKPVFSCGLNSHDSAVLDISSSKIAMTTDSFVINPIFFPGGDIGSLAVHGTVNDLAMSGAKPVYLSVSFILEEGLPIETLWRIVCSMSEAAKKAGVQIVTGDTKVVERGHGDGIYINTTGIGKILHDQIIHPREIKVGDAVIVSGDIGRHGVAVMAQRTGLQFETEIQSDSAAVAEPILELLQNGVALHCLRDCTRGGLATSLNELASSANVSIKIDEVKIPVQSGVKGACEFLGLDPLYVANEGCFVAIVPPEQAQKTVEILRKHSVSSKSAIIGVVENSKSAPLFVETVFGNKRIASVLSGEQLPRIC
jgi:hydrogenase expression/formation protein HypE